MSINHYSMDLPEATLWWPQQPILMEPTQNDEEEATTTANKESEEEKEAMFEKALTPSDVGKLNRLVIPKQHAEKYFPLSGGDSGECKGVLLSFEDESGKCWRFRYSYWNSSQSYVLTKGWSRYVKDKRLHAGDVVLFHRHRPDPHRLFIGWRSRPHSDAIPAHVSRTLGHANNTNNQAAVALGLYSAHPYPTHHYHPLSPLHAGRGCEDEKQSRRSSSSSSSSSKVLRLFGVNMECQTEHDHSGPSTPQCSYNRYPSSPT